MTNDTTPQGAAMPSDEEIMAWAMEHQTDAIKILRGSGFVRVARAVIDRWGAPQAKDSLPPELFDGFGVLKSLSPEAFKTTTAANVSDVLDAAVRLIRSRAPQAAVQSLQQNVIAALHTAEAALADIGDADREPGDDVAWCEARAARALPEVRAALASKPLQQSEPVPLTDEQICEIYYTATCQSLRTQDTRLAFEFARAVEAKLGITSKAEGAE